VWYFTNWEMGGLIDWKIIAKKQDRKWPCWDCQRACGIKLEISTLNEISSKMFWSLQSPRMPIELIFSGASKTHVTRCSTKWVKNNNNRHNYTERIRMLCDTFDWLFPFCLVWFVKKKNQKHNYLMFYIMGP
jgi:hypothetical protein